MLEVLCYVVVLMAEGITAWLFLDNVNERKTGFPRLQAAFIVVYAILFGISQVGIIWLNGVSFIVFNAVLLFSNYKVKIVSGLLQVFYLAGVLFLSEIVVGLVLAAISKDFTSYTYDLPYTVAMTVTARLIFFLVMQLSAKIFRPGSDEGNNKDLLLLSLISFSSVIMSMAICYVYMTISLDGFVGVCAIVCTFTLLLINFSVVFIYKQIRKSNEDKLEYELRLQKELANADYYEMMREQYDNQRILIHDIKRHIAVIDGLIEDKQYENVRSYLSEISEEPALNRIRYCDNSILNSIIGRYTTMCQKNGIRFTHEIHSNTLDEVSDKDVTAVFDNLLSNAYEAALTSSEKQIDVFAAKEDGAVIIKFVNSCDTAPTSDKHGIPVTTKPEFSHHGLGLKSVIRTVNKCSGIRTFEYDAESKQFVTILTLFI